MSNGKLLIGQDNRSWIMKNVLSQVRHKM